MPLSAKILQSQNLKIKLCGLTICPSVLSQSNSSAHAQIMVTVLLAPGGHRKVMQAFDYFRAIMKERTRFQLLMTSLTEEPVDHAYQVGSSWEGKGGGPRLPGIHGESFLVCMT